MREPSADVPVAAAGRAATVGRFAAAVRDAIETPPGRPSMSWRTFIIRGAPGIGKTHTMSTVLVEVGGCTPGARVFRMEAEEMSHRYPYDVLARALSIDLGYPLPHAPDEILLQRLDELCSAGPVLLALDDVHHCDAATLALLAVLTDAARALPLTLLLAHRPLPVREQLRRLARHPDVCVLDLEPMRPDDIAGIARSVLGATPGPRLRTLLDGAGGHPMHALATIEQLTGSGDLTESAGVAELKAGAAATAVSGLVEIIGDQLTLLTGPTREVVQRLAVWGAPTAPTALAELADENPLTIVEPVQAAVDTGVLRFDADGRLHFRHDLYSEVVYRRIPAALRAVLHEACVAYLRATGAPGSAIAHHLVAAGADPDRVRDVVDGAGRELESAPAVAAEVFESAAGVLPEAVEHLTLARARALAESGQLRRAADLARAALRTVQDTQTRAMLHGLVIFTSLALGEEQVTLAEIDDALARRPPAAAAERLADLAAWVRALSGHPEPVDAPSPPIATPPAAPSSTRMLTTAIRLMIAGRPVAGLEWALLSTGEPQDRSMHWNGGGTADIWPPLIELYARGPRAAVELLAHAAHAGTVRWTDPFLQFLAGGIDLAAGRLADATAQLEAGLELADRMDLGWTSLAVSSRAMIDVHQGNLTAAEHRLDRFAAEGHSYQFGFPEPGRVRVALWEAQRKRKAAAELAAQLWDQAGAAGLLQWQVLAAPGFTRIAAARGDRALIDRIVRDLAAQPRPLAPVTDALISLTLARAALDPAATIAEATSLATRFDTLGMPLAQADAWEEAACCAAAIGDRDTARAYARTASSLFLESGADTDVRRVASRLRAAGVRLGSGSARRTSTSGPESLTATEFHVAELVGSGLSGPDIAARLGVSPRTVQTHVSHALMKLGLRTRIELAVNFADRSTAPGP